MNVTHLAFLQALKIVDLYGKQGVDVSKQVYIKVCYQLSHLLSGRPSLLAHLHFASALH